MVGKTKKMVKVIGIDDERRYEIFLKKGSIVSSYSQIILINTYIHRYFHIGFIDCLTHSNSKFLTLQS